MPNCVMCGASLPDNQGSKTCSMCYGDIDHGRDGYYRQWLEEQELQRQKEQEQEQEQEQDKQILEEQELQKQKEQEQERQDED